MNTASVIITGASSGIGKAFAEVFAASRAFVLSFTRSLRAELEGEGITVSALSPGNVRTGFLEKSGLSELYKGEIPHETTAEFVAEQGYAQMRANKAIVFPDKKVKTMVKLFRILSLSDSWMEKSILGQHDHRKTALSRIAGHRE